MRPLTNKNLDLTWLRAFCLIPVLTLPAFSQPKTGLTSEPVRTASNATSAKEVQINPAPTAYRVEVTVAGSQSAEGL